MESEEERILEGQVWLLVAENLPGKTSIIDAKEIVNRIMCIFEEFESQ